MLARLVLLSGFFLIACQPIQDTSYPTSDLYPEKCLIITADDYGASKNINEGIRLAVENDAITTISVLSNFTECLPNLKRLSQNNPAIVISHTESLKWWCILGIIPVRIIISMDWMWIISEIGNVNY